jgi:hypothetical protein
VGKLEQKVLIGLRQSISNYMRLTTRRAIIATTGLTLIAIALTTLLNLGKSENALAFGSGNAIANGNWNANSTWSFSGTNRVPTCGDTITIPATKTVTVNSQENLVGCGSPIIIKVYGILQFTNGNKLDLPCNSIVYVMSGGTVKKSTAGGGSSTLISICSIDVWTAGDGPVSGPDTLWIPGGGSSLPVQLLHFNAKLTNQMVHLDWATSSEINNNYFTVERSADGEHFESIIKRTGAGNSTSTIYYSDKDENPLKGYSFYRLRQTDFDGRYCFSGIQSVKNGDDQGNSSLIIRSIYPNPFINSFHVGFFSPTALIADLSIVTPSGQRVAEGKFKTTAGFNTIEFDAGKNLKPGIYFAKLICGDHIQVRKIFKN